MDNFWQWLAWHLPRRLVMWCGYRIGAFATQGEWSWQVVPELEFMIAMKRWSDESEDSRIVALPDGNGIPADAPQKAA